MPYAAAGALAVLYSNEQRLHQPSLLMALGKTRPSRDTPARVDAILQHLAQAGFVIESPRDHGLSIVRQIHTPRYLRFLERAYREWQQLDGAAEQVYANVFALCYMGECSYPDSIVGQASFHFHDQLAPVGAHTWRAAIGAANLAQEAAVRVLEGQRFAYAVCRPPGHHAYADMAGGGTYINNAAVAAECLRQQYSRVAILDLDVHHGNGTQDIFYARSDVLFVSLHRDPASFHPFFAGYAHESGRGDGEGYNLNIVLEANTADPAYLKVALKAMRRIVDFRAEALVVSLGLDAHVSDPAHGLELTDNAFLQLGIMVRELDIPTVMVQEGGYNPLTVGTTLLAFLGGCLATRLD